ncbi:response regulator transcription factor, partial [bacterium]|nr:response regulator transcription factor [bacterium]
LVNENKILSRRELEIIILVSAGFENNQIAVIFKVTLSTVKKQLEKIYEKLHAKNRANAIYIAMCHGLIDLNDFKTVLETKDVIKFMTSCKKFSKNLYY